MHTSNWDYVSGCATDRVDREVRENGDIVWTRTDWQGNTTKKTIIVRDGEQVACFQTAGSVVVR